MFFLFLSISNKMSVKRIEQNVIAVRHDVKLEKNIINEKYIFFVLVNFLKQIQKGNNLCSYNIDWMMIIKLCVCKQNLFFSLLFFSISKWINLFIAHLKQNNNKKTEQKSVWLYKNRQWFSCCYFWFFCYFGSISLFYDVFIIIIIIVAVVCVVVIHGHYSLVSKSLIFPNAFFNDFQSFTMVIILYYFVHCLF